MKNNKLLNNIIDQAYDVLYEVTESQSEMRENPDKWSKKEELGHLIDSAANNRRRFIIAQYQSNMIFDGYDQEKWVEISGYQNWAWLEIVDSWILRNRELSNIIDRIAEDILLKEHCTHNLHKIGFQKVSAQEHVNLDFFIKDYVSHLEHHLCKIDPNYKRLLLEY